MRSELLLSLGTHEQTVEIHNPSESIKLCYFSIIKKKVCGNLYYHSEFKDSVWKTHTKLFEVQKKKELSLFINFQNFLSPVWSTVCFTGMRHMK